LKIENRTKTDIGLLDENELPIHGELSNHNFEDVGGQLISVRACQKRPASTRADFMEIPPGLSETFNVNLSQYYLVPPLTRLHLFYEAFHGPPEQSLRFPPDLDALWAVRSNVVEIDT
jgi:hypothetical protein